MLIMQVFLRSIKRLPNYNLHKLRVLQLSLRGSKPVRQKKCMYLKHLSVYKTHIFQLIHHIAVYIYIIIRKALLPMREPPRTTFVCYTIRC